MLGPNSSTFPNFTKEEEETNISSLPFDLLLIIINYVDSKTKQSLVCLKPFSLPARVSLYRFPIISNTFSWAQFTIACKNNKELAKNVLGVDLGAGSKGKARLPCVHSIADAYSRNLYLQPPVALFPFSGLLQTNITKAGLPSLPAKYCDNSNAGIQNLILDRASQPMRNELIEIWNQLFSLASSFPVLGLDQSMVHLLEQIDPVRNGDAITNMDIWLKIMQIFDRYELYFCSLEVAFQSPHPDPMPWRNFTHLLQIPPHQIQQWFERELIWFRETNGEIESPIYKTFKALCALINRFYRLKPCDCYLSQRKGSLCIYTSSLIQLSFCTPFLQSLSLAGRRLEDDEQIKETAEYVSQSGYTIPDYYTRVPVTDTDALRSILVNCQSLKHLDLSSCKWVTEEHLLLIVNHANNLVCLNLLGCSQFPSPVAKLWFFEDHTDFVTSFSPIAFPKK